MILFRPLPRLIAFFAFLLLMPMAVTPAHAVQPETLKSLVTVLPDWPGFPQGGNPSGNGRGQPAPEGSGVVIFAGGYIATNDHVLGRAKTARVRIWDGRVLPIRVVARHANTDIALLQVEADLPALQTAPPPPLGGRVCAVGNPFGTGMSVTCGVVSAINRAGMGFNPVEDFIQTDAAVNPGASGGALLDSNDRLVGMLSAIFTRDNDANIGINFAISSALLKRVVEDMRNFGQVEGGDLGMETAPVPARLRDRISGLFVARVGRLSPALASGIEAGDIITAVNGRLIRKNANLNALIFMSRPGDVLTFTVFRSGVSREVNVQVGPA